MSLTCRRGASSPACEPAFQPASGANSRTTRQAGTNAGLQAGLLAPRRYARLISGLPIRKATRMVVAGAVLAAAAIPMAGQSGVYRAPRAKGGKPDLNGIWQAINEANYDLEAHNARPAMALRPGPYGPVPAGPVLALGAVGAVPPSLGVVEGGEIPYKPEALIQKKENQENWLANDPEIKCYLPGVP